MFLLLQHGVTLCLTYADDDDDAPAMPCRRATQQRQLQVGNQQHPPK